MLSSQERTLMIASIKALPTNIRAAVAGLDDAQLDTPYRDGGWTVRQVVHHLADSHLNAYTRTRLLLTENHPTVKPYDQDAWAALLDSRLPIESSLKIIAGLHERWGATLDNVKESDFMRTLNHPDNGSMSFDDLLKAYSSHGENHIKQITDLRVRKGW
jgi:DinB superfamily